MSSTPLVTWIMPVKNGMPFLRETLASLAAQTFRDSQLLVWDNASVDDTVLELARWIPTRIPGRIITGQPRGVGGALAGLVELAETEYCARIDADDICEPDRLERQLDCLRADQNLAVLGTQLICINAASEPTGRITYPLNHDDIVIEMLVRNAIGHPSVVFRRKAVIRVGNYRDIPNVEDYDLWLRLASRERLGNLPEALTRYRQHPGSCTQEATKQKRLESAMATILATYSPELFNLSAKEIELLRSRIQPGAFIYALRTARHLSARGHKSTWDHLRSPQFVELFCRFIQARDLPSRMAFALLRLAGSASR